MDEHTLFIAIRQSGEILDILAAPREDKKKGARILSVVSVVGSAIAREADDAFYTWAGAEIAVACTAQLICMYLIRIVYGPHQGAIDQNHYRRVIGELKEIPQELTDLLKKEKEIPKLADEFFRKNEKFFMERGRMRACPVRVR